MKKNIERVREFAQKHKAAAIGCTLAVVTAISIGVGTCVVSATANQDAGDAPAISRFTATGLGFLPAEIVSVIPGSESAITPESAGAELPLSNQESNTAANPNNTEEGEGLPTETWQRGETSASDMSASSANPGAGAPASGSTEAPTPSPTPATPSPAEPQRTWVIDYSRVWVEDSPAWDEKVPTYGYNEISVCNVCGANVTGNEVAHAKAHALNYEGGGHHTEWIETITGYSTVHHEGSGHYETVESGGHWQ